MNWAVQPQKLTKSLKIQNMEVEGCCIYVATTMALITKHLICAFVFAYAKRRFSFYAAHFIVRYLATEQSYKSLMYGFRVPHNNISQIVPEVCQAIVD